jgi:hypothetical protein
MTNYFVKNGGNNGLSGTSVANAWKTITYAMSQMIAYDTLTIAAGTYAESVSITTGHITLIGPGSEFATINSLGLSQTHPTVSGLKVVGTLTNAFIYTNITLEDMVVGGLTIILGANNASITNCDFTGFLLLTEADQAVLNNNIYRAYGDATLGIRNNFGSDITLENTTIIGDSSPYHSICILGGTNTVFTNTTFTHLEKAIEVTSGATATFIQDNRRVFVGTAGATTIDAAKSTLVVGDGTYDYRDFVVSPDASIVISETPLWQVSDDKNKEWKVSATGSRTVSFRLADMLPNMEYGLKVDGVIASTETSDASGVITFAYTGSFSEKVFATSLIYHNTKRRPRKSS